MAKIITIFFIKTNTENEQFLFGKVAKRGPDSEILQFERYTQFYIFRLPVILIVTKAISPLSVSSFRVDCSKTCGNALSTCYGCIVLRPA